MSFKVNWNNLETDSLRSWTTELLTDALNSGRRPNILASDIQIKDLNFGKVAPDFEILEIGELDKDRFRGIFKINYSGDFHLTLHTKVQANPLKIYGDNSHEKEVSPSQSFITPDFLLSVEPFNLPLDLKLSDIKISGIGIIVFSKSKGLTLVFRNDPLDSIKVSSTFDTVQVLANFLQKQIETQIRDLFRETLPTLLHRLSLKYVSALTPNEVMNNLKDHLNSQQYANSLDLSESQTISSNNLRRLATLYSSRETLDLNVPKFKRIVQRNSLEKFNKHLYPNLVNSLYSKLDIATPASASSSNNSVPVELFVQNDFSNVESIVKEISSIQGKTFKSVNNNDKTSPKRRTIKMGSKLKKKKSTKETETPAPVHKSSEMARPTSMAKSNTEYCDSSSDTFVEEESSLVEQPKPVQHYKRPPLVTNYGHLASSNLSGCASPLSSNSSFIGGVGIGNFSLANAPPLSASPVSIREREKETKKHELKVKKSLNHIDIGRINEKLQMRLNESKAADTSVKGTFKHEELEAPPPPYHHITSSI
ncbi:hypothetical protein FT663_01666 [Candidozyma haemuli var. vulneris]|uniref:Mitochondrial distribution and morphology protein 34 n=1 Tax=Candidozyma haemuli TaxID=45357 RepID=A0A2V1APM9_9ASCO|nr:hypothetical protein CXQ85_001809 [[Candida] haemuloni]KAF3990591.1 hypothetical protein FT662_02152 [[Candida] haemuloni var. vulneris]KAF3993956.1 hypothetical protein FT663_01666 [[Candida] haemuloni var. vulneris]PVH20030.1 hypothetical protein CXQ85_001809 [[Candida] haemuloni]